MLTKHLQMKIISVKLRVKVSQVLHSFTKLYPLELSFSSELDHHKSETYTCYPTTEFFLRTVF